MSLSKTNLSKQDVRDFRAAMEKTTATITADNQYFADVYYVRITKVNADGSFEGKFYGGAPCM